MLPPMVVQPLIENAIKHGFKGRKDGQINITFHMDENNLIVEVKDNGIGREAAEKFPSKGDHNAIALESIRARLKSVHRFRPGSLKIDDLHHDDGTPMGTQCILKIPI